MQLLKPLCIANIGFPPRHIFGMPCIHQVSFYTFSYKDFLERHPIDACRLHGNSGNTNQKDPFGK